MNRSLGDQEKQVKPLRNHRNQLVPYQWPWTDKYGQKMSLKSWIWSRKFSIVYLVIIWAIVGVLDYASNRNCTGSWQLAFQCDRAIWMIEYKTNLWLFLQSMFTSPFFHNGFDHVLFVSIFGFMMPVQSFETQNGTLATASIFLFTYVLIGFFFGSIFNYGIENWPDSDFFMSGFARNWMGGSVGFYGIIGALSYTSRKKWFLISLVIVFALFNRLVLGINIFIPFIHVASASFGWLLCWAWFKVKKTLDYA